MELLCKIPLPGHYKTDHFLTFHKRDPHSIAVRVDGNSLEKGIILHQKPCCLIINFIENAVEAALLIDGEIEDFTEKNLETLVENFLGLSQNIEEFEKRFQTNSQISHMLSRSSGLRITTTLTFYEAFTRSVFGQQLSINAAFAICRKFVAEFGVEHSCGIYCYPSPKEIYNCEEARLKGIGCSTNKARTIIACTQAIIEEDLDLEITQNNTLDSIREYILGIKGVGQWTADNTLMRSFGWLDASMHRDLGVRKKLQDLLATPDLPSPKETEEWLSQFSPWRGLVAMHLWSNIS